MTLPALAEDTYEGCIGTSKSTSELLASLFKKSVPRCSKCLWYSGTQCALRLPFTLSFSLQQSTPATSSSDSTVDGSDSACLLRVSARTHFFAAICMRPHRVQLCRNITLGKP